VIMLLGPATETPTDKRGALPRATGVLAIAALFGMIVPTLALVQLDRPLRPTGFGSLREVGQYLFGPGMVPFELAGVTLVVAVVGAFALARGSHRRIAGAASAGAAAPASESKPAHEEEHS